MIRKEHNIDVMCDWLPREHPMLEYLSENGVTATVDAEWVEDEIDMLGSGGMDDLGGVGGDGYGDGDRDGRGMTFEARAAKSSLVRKYRNLRVALENDSMLFVDDIFDTGRTRAAIDAARLDDAQRRAILQGNARKLLARFD